MEPWQCCRTCLSEQNLNPIFPVLEHHEKYTNIIIAATGIKIETNDALPQEMCSECINFINDSYKFRKKCEDSQKTLQERLSCKETHIRTESSTLKTEQMTTIDISNILSDDLDDNVTLNEYNYEVPINKDETEFETRVQDIVEKPMEIIFNRKKLKKINDKPIRRKLRAKKESKKDEGRKEILERVREDIECEYCHKILTSKLSLRNHYKIHTGFDVVCEHCGKKFITRRLLLMHCRAKHGYEKTDKCSFCDYRASNAEQVKIHERLHTGERPYVCAECGAGFHRKSSYLQHVAIHLPEKTVQCDQCPARFKSVTLMRIHKNRHRAPQYSFKCRVCENSFARRRNVARHLQRIHGLPPDQEHIDRAKIA